MMKTFLSEPVDGKPAFLMKKEHSHRSLLENYSKLFRKVIFQNTPEMIPLYSVLVFL